MKKYNKNYASKEEYAFRYAEFSSRVKMIEHNNYHLDSTHELALNEFSDLTKEEWDKLLPQLKPHNTSMPYLNTTCGGDKQLGCSLPQSINWKDKGFVTAVKKTKPDCLFASYAFAAADMVEATYFKATG